MYWFKPKRFWKWFAAYYPVSREGWIVSILSIGFFIYFFWSSDLNSHSGSDTLIAFAPKAIFVLIIFDMFTRFKGEYPSWWRKHGTS